MYQSPAHQGHTLYMYSPQCLYFTSYLRGIWTNIAFLFPRRPALSINHPVSQTHWSFRITSGPPYLNPHPISWKTPPDATLGLSGGEKSLVLNIVIPESELDESCLSFSWNKTKISIIDQEYIQGCTWWCSINCLFKFKLCHDKFNKLWKMWY